MWPQSTIRHTTPFSSSILPWFFSQQVAPPGPSMYTDRLIGKYLVQIHQTKSTSCVSLPINMLINLLSSKSDKSPSMQWKLPENYRIHICFPYRIQFPILFFPFPGPPLCLSFAFLSVVLTNWRHKVEKYRENQTSFVAQRPRYCLISDTRWSQVWKRQLIAASTFSTFSGLSIFGKLDSLSTLLRNSIKLWCSGSSWSE